MIKEKKILIVLIITLITISSYANEFQGSYEGDYSFPIAANVLNYTGISLETAGYIFITTDITGIGIAGGFVFLGIGLICEAIVAPILTYMDYYKLKESNAISTSIEYNTSFWYGISYASWVVELIGLIIFLVNKFKIDRTFYNVLGSVLMVIGALATHSFRSVSVSIPLFSYKF